MIIRRDISPYLIAAFESVRTALTKIDRNEDGIIFCVDEDGVLLGLMTDGDVRRWLVATPKPDLDQPVSAVINRNYVSANVEDRPERIGALLKGTLEILPLVDKNGCCVAM